MNRRDVLLQTSAMFVSASIGALACGGNNAVAQNTPKTPPTAPPTSGGHAHHHAGDAALADAVDGCIAKGQACIAHCLGLLATGDTSMGGCAKAVHDMRAVMLAVSAAASNASRHLPALSKVALEFCKDCQVECAKHADKHAVCKACHDACARAVVELQRAAG